MMSQNKLKCAECKKPIDKKIFTALGKKWHPNHFRCTKCSKVISNQTFFEKNGSPYCRNDFTKLFHNKCERCKEYILTKAVKLLNKYWHVNCFTCSICQKLIKPPSYFVKEGKLYCAEDYKMTFASKCKGCKEYILDKQLNLLGNTWHCDCFVCKDCKKPIEKKYYLVNDDPICAICINNDKYQLKRCYQNCCSFKEDHY